MHWLALQLYTAHFAWLAPVGCLKSNLFLTKIYFENEPLENTFHLESMQFPSLKLIIKYFLFKYFNVFLTKLCTFSRHKDVKKQTFLIAPPL